MTRRGFTLIEMLVALGVGSLALIAAAQIATMGVQSSGRGEQATEMASRTRLVAQQLRSDLSHAGYGSNGLIGVTGPWWASAGAGTVFATPFGSQAIAAIRGANNLVNGSQVGGVPVLRESDVVQLVVPDPDPTPGRIRRVEVPIAAGAFTLTLPPPDPLAPNPMPTGCPFLYVVDHASPNGAGRTQILRHNGAPSTTTITLLDPLAFPLPQGSEVLCARVSTYWVDRTFRLHRSDLSPTAPMVAVGATGLVTTVAATDVIAPGVVDLQLAFVFNAMAPGASAAVHTMGALPPAGPYAPGAGVGWAEVRSVRYTLVGRALRQVTNPGRNIDIPQFEDRPANTVQMPSTYDTHVVAGGVELTTLRYFDEIADANVAAEPY